MSRSKRSASWQPTSTRTASSKPPANKRPPTLDPGKWIDESFESPNKHGYTKDVLKKVADREGHSHLGPLDLSPAYKLKPKK